MRCGTSGLSRLLEARADSNPPTGFSPLLMAVAHWQYPPCHSFALLPRCPAMVWNPVGFSSRLIGCYDPACPAKSWAWRHLRTDTAPSSRGG